MPEPIALWVAPVSNLAGVARHILDVAAVGLPGYRLVVTAPEGPLLERLRATGCPVIPLPVDGPVSHTVRSLRTTIRRLNPVVVHSHLAKADFLVTMAAAGLPVTLVSTEHHIPEDPLTFHGTRAKALTRQAAHHMRIRRFAALIAVSESTERDMLRYWKPAAPITVVRNAVDRLGSPARPAGLRILSLTRLSPEKNLEATLRTFAAVQRVHPEATLTVAGNGPELERLEQLADELGIADSVSFPGHVDPTAAMTSHDVLLQPSKADNLSYTLLDAVNAGMGVVASSIGGNPEILPAHCLAGADDIDSLAAAVVDQAVHPDRRPALPTHVPTVARMAAEIVEVYRVAVPHDLIRPTGARPVVSVIIAFFRDDATLADQLEALANQIDAPEFEVIVADNEGSPTLPALLNTFAGRLALHRVTATAVRGAGHARNAGVAAATGLHILICDGDDVVGPRWVGSLSAALDHRDALVTGPLRLDRINPEYAWRTYLGVDSTIATQRPVDQLPFRFLGYERFAVGCNMGFRRDAFTLVGGFEEHIIGGTEDVDLSWRFLESGRELFCIDEAVVDYRLRTEPRAVFTQRRGYARSQLRLWAMSRDLGRPVRGMSLRWAITETAKLPGSALRMRGRSKPDRFQWSAHAGGVLGNLEGQLRERRPGRRGVR